MGRTKDAPASREHTKKALSTTRTTAAGEQEHLVVRSETAMHAAVRTINPDADRAARLALHAPRELRRDALAHAHDDDNAPLARAVVRQRRDCPRVRAERVREPEPPEAEEDVLARGPAHARRHGDRHAEERVRHRGHVPGERDARVVHGAQDAEEPGGDVERRCRPEVVPAAASMSVRATRN
jgi:hypothetical protein